MFLTLVKTNGTTEGKHQFQKVQFWLQENSQPHKVSKTILYFKDFRTIRESGIIFVLMKSS